jgi:branched-chain amino acid transport system ATP-binding protein
VAVAEVVVETEALVMRFDGVIAVNDVSMRLRKRELLCLIGPNGAGKTTFFRCLTGQYAPSAGKIWIEGRAVAGWPIHAIARLGCRDQNPGAQPGQRAERAGKHLAGRARRHAAIGAADLRVDELLTELELTAHAASLTGSLAHGIRQMVEIGVALSSNPWLLLLDEPAGGLTKEEAARVGEVIRKLNQRITVVVVEHDMEFVRSVASRVLVFHQGRVIADGPADTVLAEALVRQVYLGSKVR